VCPGGYCHFGAWSRQTYFGTRTHSQSSPLCFENHWLTNFWIVNIKAWHMKTCRSGWKLLRL
jgi:hypothetical protein